MHKKIICALCALTILGASGCKDIGDSSETSSAPETTVTSAPAEPVRENRLGPKLQKVADIYDGKQFTLECTMTSTEFSGSVKIKRVVSGADKYQLQTEQAGSHGTVTINGKCYDFDYACGMYRETDSEPELNVVEQIRAMGLAPEAGRSLAPEDEKTYDFEIYTYTGETYITTLEFFFDKQDGHLVKYITEYRVEGRDDMVETRVIDRLDSSVDSSVFNAYFADDLVNFTEMSEEERLGFCRGVLASRGITAEELFELGISAADLKTIDYNTLFRLVYTYDSNAPAPDDSSSEASPAAESEPADSSTSEQQSEDTSSESSVADDTQ